MKIETLCMQYSESHMYQLKKEMIYWKKVISLKQIQTLICFTVVLYVSHKNNTEYIDVGIWEDSRISALVVLVFSWTEYSTFPAFK